MLRSRPLWRQHISPAIQRREHGLTFVNPKHLFSSATNLSHKSGNHLPPRPTLSDSEIKEAYVKGTGPGGQAINKTSSAAQLTHIPTGIVVKSQATRSKNQNYTIARRLLAEKVELLQKGDQSRAAKVVDRKSRKKRSADKKKRRKYRQLEEVKDGQEGEVDEDDDTNGGEATDDEVEIEKSDGRDDTTAPRKRE